MGKALGSGRMVDGLQILADRSPQSAGKIATWVTSATDNHSYPVPVNRACQCEKGRHRRHAWPGHYRQTRNERHGPVWSPKYPGPLHGSLNDGKDAGKTEGKESFDNFNANLHPNLQDVFDSIVKGTGDLYTKKHQFEQ